jgi:hypothetical protein
LRLGLHAAVPAFDLKPNISGALTLQIAQEQIATAIITSVFRVVFDLLLRPHNTAHFLQNILRQKLLKKSTAYQDIVGFSSQFYPQKYLAKKAHYRRDLV